MKKNVPEVSLREVLEERPTGRLLRVLPDTAAILAELAEHYPFTGSRIAWSNVPGAIERPGENEGSACVAFFDEMTARFKLQGEVTYVGDSLTEFGVQGSIEAIREVLSPLISIPHHHYFIGAHLQWCMSFTFEGDMAFGFSPSTRLSLH
jgi:hypothetical protein